MSLTVSSENTVSLSLEISLQTCVGDRFRNSSCCTTSLKEHKGIRNLLPLHHFVFCDSLSLTLDKLRLPQGRVFQYSTSLMFVSNL